MNIDYQKITEVASTAKQTQMGGRKQIEAQQLHNLRQLVEKIRRESPLFAELYKHVPPSDAVQLQDLPVTRKPELMAQFDRWLMYSLPISFKNILKSENLTVYLSLLTRV